VSRWIAGLLLATACVDGGADTGDDTCCAFACDDKTQGQIGFAVDADDCAAYAEQQCGLNDAVVTDAEFSDQRC
jgi:hypothetical protein